MSALTAIAPVADEPEASERVPLGFVYCVVHHERHAAMIGYSADPDRRFRQLQTACADPLTLFGKIPGNTGLEALFHRYFASRKMMGEWFDNRDSAVTQLFGKLSYDPRSVLPGASL